MAINIKELFSVDSDNTRLDKINYNFDQIVANGGGPTGATGAKGSVGPQGSKGQKGEVGATGAKGDPGTATDYFFKNSNTRNITLTPKWDDGDPQNEAASLVLGETPADDSSATVENQAPLTLVKDDSVANPFEFLFKLRTENVSEYIFGDIELTGSDIILKFNKSALGSLDARYHFFGKSFKLNNGVSDKVILDETSSVFNSDLDLNGANNFNGAAVFNSTFRIPASAGAGKVLVSDASGYGSWQAQTSDVPVGMIVMVSKFVLDSNVDWVGSGNQIDYIGRGTGDWAGWYYCWGQTWGVNGALTYQTPDLRERYPIGYVNNAVAVTGTSGYATSDEVKYVAAGTAQHSTSGTAGYFGVNDVDDLQAKQTAEAHTHNVTVTPVTRTEPDVIGVDATYAADTPVTTTSTSNGATTTDITPRSAVIGFMIYLGSSTLSYDTLPPSGPEELGTSGL